MLYRARIALLLLSALSAHLVPACGRSYGRDRDVARATSAPDHGSFALAAMHHVPPLVPTQASVSCLSTTAGSSRIAWTAGPRAAASATAAMNPATRTIVDQSAGATPYN